MQANSFMGLKSSHVQWEKIYNNKLSTHYVQQCSFFLHWFCFSEFASLVIPSVFLISLSFALKFIVLHLGDYLPHWWCHCTLYLTLLFVWWELFENSSTYVTIMVLICFWPYLCPSRSFSFNSSGEVFNVSGTMCCFRNFLKSLSMSRSCSNYTQTYKYGSHFAIELQLCSLLVSYFFFHILISSQLIILKF